MSSSNGMMVRRPLRECVELWVVYESPLDHPVRFVARKWYLDKPSEELLSDTTLDGLRRQLPEGLICIPRDPADEPQILESWI